MLLTALAAFFGAVLSLLANMFIEYQKKPLLSFSIETPPLDADYPNSQVKKARFLRIHLHNKEMPRILKWLGRNAAIQCHGYIRFYHINNFSPVFSENMPIRWSQAAEPLLYFPLDGHQPQWYLDPTKFNLAFRRDCYPGNSELFDVAARFDRDTDCYGWTNENYFPDMRWRKDKWKLPQGRYIVKIVVDSAGDKISEVFELENSVSVDHFRLSTVTDTRVTKKLL